MLCIQHNSICDSSCFLEELLLLMERDQIPRNYLGTSTVAFPGPSSSEDDYLQQLAQVHYYFLSTTFSLQTRFATYTELSLSFVRSSDVGCWSVCYVESIFYVYTKAQTAYEATLNLERILVKSMKGGGAAICVRYEIPVLSEVHVCSFCIFQLGIV